MSCIRLRQLTCPYVPYLVLITILLCFSNVRNDDTSSFSIGDIESFRFGSSHHAQPSKINGSVLPPGLVEQELNKNAPKENGIPNTPRALVTYILDHAVQRYQAKGKKGKRLIRKFLKLGVGPRDVRKETEHLHSVLSSELASMLAVFLKDGISNAIIAKCLDVEPVIPDRPSRHSVSVEDENSSVDPIQIPVVLPYDKQPKRTAQLSPSLPSPPPLPSPIQEGSPDRFRTTCEETHMLIVASTRDTTIQRIRKRADGLPGHLSVVSGPLKITIHISPVAKGKFVCQAFDSKRLRRFKRYVEQWCSSLMLWVTSTLPSVAAMTTSFDLGVSLKTELSCSTIASQIFSGDEVLYHSDLLWGRFHDLGPLASIPVNEYELLSRWSRVAIIQTRKLNDAYRDYIVLRYLAQDPLGRAFMEQVSAGCPVTLPILARANTLRRRHLSVRWPPDFKFSRVYQAMLPICLGVYPSGTEVEYDISDSSTFRYSIVCDTTHGFIVGNT